MKTEMILEHAEVAAVYLRALVEKGVPMHYAVSMTCSYVQSVVIAALSRDKPKEPWEEEGK